MRPLALAIAGAVLLGAAQAVAVFALAPLRTVPVSHQQVHEALQPSEFAGTLLLGGATLAQITAPGSFAVHPFFWLIALTYGLTIVWAWCLRYVERYRWLVDAQLGCDAVVVSAFIFLTGGVTSFFSSLYALPIIAGSVIQFRRGGMMVATLSGVVSWINAGGGGISLDTVSTS